MQLLLVQVTLTLGLYSDLAFIWDPASI